MFVASDMPAILQYTRARSSCKKARSSSSAATATASPTSTAKPIEREPIAITWDACSAEKSGFKHFMLKEIFEQPNVIKETLSGRIDESRDVQLGAELGGSKTSACAR